MPPLRGSWGSRHVGWGQHCVFLCGGGHLAGSGGKPPARLDLEALWDVPSLMLPVWVRSWNVVLSPLHPQAKGWLWKQEWFQVLWIQSPKKEEWGTTVISLGVVLSTWGTKEKNTKNLFWTIDFISTRVSISHLLKMSPINGISYAYRRSVPNPFFSQVCLIRIIILRSIFDEGARDSWGCKSQGPVEWGCSDQPATQGNGSIRQWGLDGARLHSLTFFLSRGSLWECRSQTASWKSPAWLYRSSSGLSPQAKTQILPGRNPFIKLFRNWTVTSQRYSNLPAIPRNCFRIKIPQSEEWLVWLSWVWFSNGSQYSCSHIKRA